MKLIETNMERMITAVGVRIWCRGKARLPGNLRLHGER